MSPRDEAREALVQRSRRATTRAALARGFDAGATWQAEQAEQASVIERDALNTALLGAAEKMLQAKDADNQRLRAALEACVEALEGLPCDIGTPPVGGQAFVCRTHHQLAPCDEGMQRDAAIAQAREALEMSEAPQVGDGNPPAALGGLAPASRSGRGG